MVEAANNTKFLLTIKEDISLFYPISTLDVDGKTNNLKKGFLIRLEIGNPIYFEAESNVFYKKIDAGGIHKLVSFPAKNID